MAAYPKPETGRRNPVSTAAAVLNGYAFHVGGDGAKSGEHRIVVMQGGEQGADGRHGQGFQAGGRHQRRAGRL